MSFMRGNSRHQIQMPSSLDEMIAKDNPVRLIDEFANGLNLLNLGFDCAKTGFQNAMVKKDTP